MMNEKVAPPDSGWKQSLTAIFERRVISMTFLGFSAGVPLLLIFSSLSLWLNEAGIERSSITLFSYAALAYSFKFVWAPIVDRLPIPVLTQKLGIRRSWLLLSQLCVMGSIASIAFVDPALSADSLAVMAFAVIALGFSAATQDIVIDAYRIEAAPSSMQGLLSAAYVFGYRISMLASGAGALYLASYFGSTSDVYSYEAWRSTYLIMSSVMLIGVITTFSVGSPEFGRVSTEDYSLSEYAKFVVLFLVSVVIFVLSFVQIGQYKELLLSFFDNKILLIVLPALYEFFKIIISAIFALCIAYILVVFKLVNQSMLNETYIKPVSDFFERYHLKYALIILALIGCYRVSDIVLGVISNLFYQDIGYSKQQIAAAVKTFGLIATIIGAYVGGIFVVRFGVMRILLAGAIAGSVTNLFFILLASSDPSLAMLYLVVGLDNFSAGLATSAFIAFLSSLVNISFTAMQYAIFSSLMTLFPKLLGGYSGAIVNTIDYPGFFVVTAVLGIPAILLILFLQKYILVDDKGIKLSNEISR